MDGLQIVQEEADGVPEAEEATRWRQAVGVWNPLQPD